MTDNISKNEELLDNKLASGSETSYNLAPQNIPGELTISTKTTIIDKIKDNHTETDKKRETEEAGDVLQHPVANPIWLSISEAAKIGGVNTKTIRRAIQSEKIKYKIHKDRYLVGLRSLIHFLYTNKKLKNKLSFNGIGQYVKEWRD